MVLLLLFTLITMIKYYSFDYSLTIFLYQSKQIKKSFKFSFFFIIQNLIVQIIYKLNFTFSALDIMEVTITPKSVVYNSQISQNSCKKLKHADEGSPKLEEAIFAQNMISATSNEINDIHQLGIFSKPTFRQKLRALKRKKDSLKNVLSNLQRGPKRIMRKYLRNRKSSQQKYEEDDGSEEFDENFDENTHEQTDVADLHGFKVQESCESDQNSSYNFTNSKNKKASKKLTNRYSINDQLTLPIPEARKLHFRVIRRNQGMKMFAPEFDLIDEENNGVIYCKKTGIFQFAFSLKRGEWEEASDFYLGKLISNVSGGVLNLFLKCRYKQKVEERIMCSIEYTNGFLSFKNPRTIKVYMLDLSRTDPLQKSTVKHTSLSHLPGQQRRNSRILYFQNRIPIFSKEKKYYILDFHGRAPVSSIKNFILECPEHKGREYLLFGKLGQNEYNLDFMYPLSILGAFAIAVTSFNGKLVCE